jgi:hypothetical protein
LIDVENNMWVWRVRRQQFSWPQAILATAEDIYEMIEDNPSSILFFGPKEMADMTWFTPCALDDRVTRMVNAMEI